MKNENKVFALIVTYSDRFNFLKQVIQGCFEVGVNKVIVVDNNSKETSKNKLKSFERTNSENLSVIYLNKNIGSAGGYKIGLQEIINNQKDCDFIWLLDDDNLPKEKSLEELKSFWKSLTHKNKSSTVSLLAFRKDRKTYKEAVQRNLPNLVLGRNNSFLGFHLFELPLKLTKFLRIKPDTTKPTKNYAQSGLITVSPYGGMFFHKKLIAKIGYPNEKFFVYVDDHEWSYRLTKNNGFIYLVLSSLIDDIEPSWNIKKEKKTIFNNIANGDFFRIYYSVRNRVFFEKKHLVTNSFIYKLNILIFKWLLLLTGGMKHSNYKIFTESIKDGIKGNLGENENYSI